ncbi:MAG: AMP-binding protein, partial [Proteobacteria bacterium]|nr:AMP-binding protein [Pseudomonadota bacterium]
MKKRPLWTPSEQHIHNSQIWYFQQFINKKYLRNIKSYPQLHEFSVNFRDKFWRSLIEFCEVIYHQDSNTDLIDEGHMIDAKWFEGMTLNFAENLLKNKGDETAIIFENELGESSSLSHNDLIRQVSQVQQKLLELGVTKGDRVAAFMPNIPETIVAMLACTSLGAIWSSCSPDFGINGVLDRFGQIKPKVLFAANAYHYNGKTYDCLEKIEQICRQIPSIKQTIIVEFVPSEQSEINIDRAISHQQWINNTDP